MTTREKLEARTLQDDQGCYVWQGGKTRNGYGTVRHEGKTYYVHRLAYEITYGVIPKGLQIDHLCRNRLCWKPEHLEAVTQRENLLRGNTITAKNAAATSCAKGHPYDNENTIRLKNGHRVCRTCKRQRDRERHQKKPKKSEISGLPAPENRTHCPQGHEYTPENTLHRGPDKKWRRCRTCERIRHQRRRSRS